MVNDIFKRYAFSNSILVFLVLFGLIFSVALQAQNVKWTNDAELIDYVNFGDEESEQAASLEVKSADASTGGLEQPYRYLRGADGNASLTFRLKVPPDGENYITLKFWGSEYEEKPVKERYSHNMPVVLKLGEDGRTIPPQGGPNRDKAIPTDPGNYSADSLEKNRRPQFAKRFFYVTYKIPDGVVGSDQTKLQIKIVGNKGNYGTNLSPGIYRAYTHTDPFFQPMDDEPRGTKPEAKLKDPPTAERKTRRNNNRIESAMSYQYYGSPWDEWVEEGKMPAYLYGAFEKHGGKRPNPERVQDWDEETWRTFLGTFPNEIRPARQFLEVARAYNIENSDYYRDEQILDRVAQALDVAVVAQGSNGGWGFRRPDQDVGRPTGWLGAPDRQVASAGLYPGLKHFVHAFQEVQSALQEKGFLDEPLNHDLDPDTPPIPRRTAYERMFEGVRALYVSDAGQQGVTNQQLHNLAFAIRANQVLQKMGNKGWGMEQEWTDEMLPQGLSVHPDFEGVNSFADMVEVSVGLKENAEGTREFSPSGMPNEAGYSSGYGRGSVGQVAEMADVSGYPPVEKVAEKAKEAFSHFRYPSFDPDGYKLMRWEGIISARGGRFYPGEPAGYVYKGNEFGPPAPMLGDDDVMWTDPYIGLIAMKHNGNRMYLKLNWRGAWRERGGDQSFKADDITSGVSGLARIHYTTDKVDRFGSVHMEAPYGYRRLYEMDYGDYLIRMNLSRKHTYPINIPERLHGVEALDLVSGKRGKLKDGIKLGPRTTRVFYIGNE